MKLSMNVCSEYCGVCIALLTTIVSATRSLGEVSMDQMENCQQVRRPKHDIIQGDVFIVKSDGYSGKVASDNRQPAECSVGFNFGDRLMSVSVIDWNCDRAYSEPYLSVYADCDGRQKTLLAHLNCSTSKPISDIDSSTSCLLLYHFRGHRKGGYYFVLHVVAGHERIAFPAGGIAAIVIATVVMVMVIAKVICVVTGYERRLPNVDCDGEDDGDQRKRMYTNSNFSRSSIGACSLTSDQQVASVSRPVADFVDPVTIGVDNGFVLGPEHMTHRVQSEQCIQQPQPQQQYQHSHREQYHHQHQCHTSQPSLCVTHSNGSVASVLSSSAVAAAALSAATELAANCNFDLDFLDLPTEDGYAPRLKRYPSARASNMWRHK